MCFSAKDLVFLGNAETLQYGPCCGNFSSLGTFLQRLGRSQCLLVLIQNHLQFSLYITVMWKAYDGAGGRDSKMT